MTKKNPAACGARGAGGSARAGRGARPKHTTRRKRAQLIGAPTVIGSMESHLLHITRFRDVKAKTAESHIRSLPEIAAEILQTTAPTKSMLPWLKLARFGMRRSAAGSLRHNENVLSFSGVELDYDGEEISFHAALARLRELGCRALIYTSPSHTIARPRFRLLLPTSQEIWQPELRKVPVSRVDNFFGNVFAKESYGLSTSYYFGRAEDNKEADHRCVVIDGDYLDLRDDMARFDDVGNEGVIDPLDAMMLADAGKGISTRPEDYNSFAPMSVADLETEMRFALSVIPADDYDLWLRIGAAIHDGLGDAGYSLFDEWSQECPAKYKPRDCEQKWRQCQKMRSIRVQTIFWHADRCDPGWRAQWRRYMSGGVAA